MRVCCVMMQRNEVNALEPWLRYHAHLFGLENLCVIDHGSDHPAVIATLAAYEAQGLQLRRLPAEADYRRKGGSSPRCCGPSCSRGSSVATR